jgi:DNA-binding LacI/PurR family transcriptional regulator
MKDRKRNDTKQSAVTLKTVAEHVGLTPGTVSAVLNNSPASRSFPEHTRNRILAAVSELNYRPNYFARSLRVKRTYTIGVITEEIGDPYGGIIVSGIEQYLRQRDFFFLAVAHRHDPKLLQTYAHLLLERGVEGFITMDTSINEPPALPTIAIAGHRLVEGVTNLILDHRSAAQMALMHLNQLGHKEIAFMKGPPTSSDSEDRWQAITQVSSELGIQIRPELVIRLEGDAVTPDFGYVFAKRFLARNHEPFTALFAYNDNSAIGAIRAIHEAGLRVPDDISVVGFDDIESAAYNNPAITTVRQPLKKMGEIAARALLNQIENSEPRVSEITIEPEFVVRSSTAVARANRKPAALKLA